MPYKPRQMRTILIKKLHCEESQGRRHTTYKIYHDGHEIASTQISRNCPEISDELVKRMATELCIQKNQLDTICGCIHGWTDYLGFYNADINPHRSIKQKLG